MELKQKSRFDTRLPKEQKELFERAAILGGYRNLTDFVVATLQEKAKEIVAQHEKILVSKRDNEVFFDAIINPPAPNKDLINALSEYEKLTNK